VFVGVDEGAFAAKGLNVAVEPLSDTGKVMVSVASGQLPLGIVTMGAATFNAVNRGTDVKLIAAGGQEPLGHGAFAPLVVRTDLYDSGAIKSPAQLKGHKVALNAKGISVEYSFYKLLSVNGLNMGDVDVTYLPFPDQVTALGNKAIDAGIIGHPLADQAIAKGVGKLLSDDFAPGTQAGVVMVNTKFADQHPQAITDFLNVYVDQIHQLNDGKLKKDDKALGIVEKYTKVSKDVMLRGPDQHWPNDGKINRPSLNDQQQYYLSAKELDYSQPIDLTKLIDEHWLDAASATPK
jgi:NitT/TauT family transport system substrate-binding protein